MATSFIPPSVTDVLHEFNLYGENVEFGDHYFYVRYKGWRRFPIFMIKPHLPIGWEVSIMN